LARGERNVTFAVASFSLVRATVQNCAQ
jgi:hypothetical protein